MRLYRGFNRNYKFFRRLFIFTLIITLSIIQIESQIIPLLNNITINRARELATDSINSAVYNILNEEDLSYKNLVQIIYDEENNIKAIETNALLINQFKSEVSLKMQRIIAKGEDYTVKIPICAFLGLELLRNTGPEISTEINLIGNITTDISSSLVSSGINQNLHSIILEVTGDISVISTGVNEMISIKTNYIIAQTVIVGKIPNIMLYDPSK